MAKTAGNVCAFCGQKAGGILGSLKNTSNKEIFAHHNCLIFSPRVFTKDSGYESEFDIRSVLGEIRRGRTLKCSYCKNPGATIGCDIKECQKTYHYECVKKDGGIRDESQYIVFCSRHANKRNAAEDIESSRTPDCSSTSHENKKWGKRKRKSIHGNYSSQHANKKNNATPDTKRSSSSERPSTSYGNRTLRKMRRKSEPGLISNQNLKHTRKTGDDSEDQQTGINGESNGDNLKTPSVTSSKTWKNRLRNGQAKLNSRKFNKKVYNESNSDSDNCCTEIKNQGELTGDDDPDGTESESSEISSMNNKVRQFSNVSKTTSVTVSSKVKESSIFKDHNTRQSELSESSLEDTRKERNPRDEDQHGMQCELCASSSHDGENFNRMEIELPESDVLSDSASNRSVLILPEVTCQGHVQQQTDDADVGFAINLVHFLRKVPEDKKLPTQIAILNVLLSVLGQQPMSTPNTDCVPKQYSNHTSPRLNRQTQPPTA